MATQPRRKRKRPPLDRFLAGGGAGHAWCSVSCRDVGSDNGAVAIMPSGSRSTSSVFFAVAEGSEIGKGVEAGVMSAFKPDLQRVLADQGYVANTQLVVWQGAKPGQPARCARLAAALGAWARPAQAVCVIGAAVSALPRDVHHLRGAIDVDGDGERVWLFQRTLITGSWRNDWIDVRAAICEAISMKALAPTESGREMTTGTPASASSRIPSSSGTAPRNGTPSLLAADSAPPVPMMSCRCPQSGLTT